MELRTKIRNFIRKNFISFEEESDIQFADSDDIFEMGFVSSLFAMKLLNYVEDEFCIVVENEEISIRNFRSVDSIASLVEKKINQEA